MTEFFTTFAWIGAFLLVLGIGGIIIECVCSSPIVSRYIEWVFRNSPLGREDVQELNRWLGRRK